MVPWGLAEEMDLFQFAALLVEVWKALIVLETLALLLVSEPAGLLVAVKRKLPIVGACLLSGAELACSVKWKHS